MSTIIIKKERNSSLELLRILAMLFIVLSHACVHSRFDLSSSSVNINSLFVQWGVLGNLGVDIYVLISGYFLCKKENNYYSIIKLLLQVWFYSYLLFVICRCIFDFSYTSKDYFRFFFPTLFKEYWFFTAYFVLNLLSPYINIFLKKSNRVVIRNMIIMMFVIWIILPTFTLQSMYSNELVQILFFYIVGAYFRLYPDFTIKNNLITIGLTIISFLLLFSSTVVLNVLGEYISFFQNKGTVFYNRDSLLVVICAIGLFSSFLNFPAFTNKFINRVAACTFGVYLIHDNPAMRNILWINIFKHAEQLESNDLIFRIIISVLIVFTVSTIVEYLRILILGDFFDKSANYIKKKLTILKARIISK